MSSSSSTHCDCVYCRYGVDYAAGYGTCPFYPTMGQPYVYYAQVPREQIDRRKNPNCFVRAFRWYTQEHIQPGPAQEQPRTQPQYAETCTSAADPDDVVGFANWLDAKYDQYLRDGRGHEDRHVIITQTSESMGVTAQCQSQPGGNKRFTRIRLQSPWRKRRHYINHASEAGDVPIETNKSVVYLLEPKDLPRPISECCQVSSTPCCSTATVVKKATCSRSATNTFARSDFEHIDPVFVQEGISSNKPQQATERGCKPECRKKADSKLTSSVDKQKSCSRSKISNLFRAKKTESPISLKNASCECSTLPPPRPMVDMGTQYDIMIKFACECTSRPAVSGPIHPRTDPVLTEPKPITPAAPVESKSKQTWFQNSRLKMTSLKMFPFRTQNDVECQCEPDPMLDKVHYCTQCGCHCKDMREKLLYCDCMRKACVKKAPTQVPLMQQTLRPWPSSMQQEYISEPVKPPLPSTPSPSHMQREYIPKPVMQPPTPPSHMAQEYIPKPMMSPPPPPAAIQQEYIPKPVRPPPMQQDYITKPVIPPPLPPSPMQQDYIPNPVMPPPAPPSSMQKEYVPKPQTPPPPPLPATSAFISPLTTQPVREVSMATEPLVKIIPPQQTPVSQVLMSEPLAPVHSEPYALKGMLGRISFPCTTCDSAQTSDHAINLDQGTIRGYPLFLKIVCADRLNDDCLCRQ